MINNPYKFIGKQEKMMGMLHLRHQVYLIFKAGSEQPLKEMVETGLLPRRYGRQTCSFLPQLHRGTAQGNKNQHVFRKEYSPAKKTLTVL